MVSELMQTLELSLQTANSRLSFVVTEPPSAEDHMTLLLDGALSAARRHNTPLVEIQLAMEQFPSMGPQYWHVPVTESGDRNIVRLVFEPSLTRTAA
ncbi:hypothetical protein NK718_16960 [Alsobacter sp. SYSU M60028]|uniref:Uncharacterized protein n=1 Tax=Alsobacter ponti TaxID=2962936 RepID=A0ABT1LJ20_9HYPH|nr:hypothetical protein [Alsobacter ponti]MCP8940218.1 hypothetical protein [Alsobacter ponti]